MDQTGVEKLVALRESAMDFVVSLQRGSYGAPTETDLQIAGALHVFIAAASVDYP
jgi:hypothetical protein